MSRIAKAPVTFAAGVTATVENGVVTVKGKLGELSQKILDKVEVKLENGVMTFAAKDASREANMASGTMRALVANMNTGVSVGFAKKLQLIGVGYRAQASGDTLNLQLGYSHPIAHKMPAGVKVECPSQTEIVIKGADIQAVGQVAAVVRSYRAPEPYKGKGVRYVDEHVVIKETKKK